MAVRFIYVFVSPPNFIPCFPTLEGNSLRWYLDLYWFYTEGERRLKLAEQCKLLMVGETENTAEGKYKDFECEAGWNALAQKSERLSTVLKH